MGGNALEAGGEFWTAWAMLGSYERNRDFDQSGIALPASWTVHSSWAVRYGASSAFGWSWVGPPLLLFDGSGRRPVDPSPSARRCAVHRPTAWDSQFASPPASDSKGASLPAQGTDGRTRILPDCGFWCDVPPRSPCRSACSLIFPSHGAAGLASLAAATRPLDRIRGGFRHCGPPRPQCPDCPNVPNAVQPGWKARVDLSLSRRWVLL